MESKSSQEIHQQIGRLSLLEQQAYEAERQEAEAKYQREQTEEKARPQRELEQSAKRLAEYYSELSLQEKANEEWQRTRYSERIAAIVALLPPPETMPKCRDCGHSLWFQQYQMPPYADSDNISLKCTGCGQLVLSKWAENPFRVAEVSSAMW